MEVSRKYFQSFYEMCDSCIGRGGESDMKNSKFAVISDGSCDLPEELAAVKEITVVPFYVSFDGETYRKEGTEISIRDFYRGMVEQPGVYPKSSMPSIQDYADVFQPFAQAHIPVLCICITTKFSGSMQSALNAREMVLSQYEDAQIEVIDATVNTVLQGLFVQEAVSMREEGMTLSEAVAALDGIKESGRIFFTIGSMDYLKHGGRIGKVAGAAASVLGIRPIITLKQGEIFPSGISRSRKKSVDKVIALLLDYLKENGEPMSSYRFTVGFGFDREEAVLFKDQLLAVLRTGGYELEDACISQIGATIAVHTGPYPLGVGIIRRHKKERQGE